MGNEGGSIATARTFVIPAPKENSSFFGVIEGRCEYFKGFWRFQSFPGPRRNGRVGAVRAFSEENHTPKGRPLPSAQTRIMNVIPLRTLLAFSTAGLAAGARAAAPAD